MDNKIIGRAVSSKQIKSDKSEDAYITTVFQQYEFSGPLVLELQIYTFLDCICRKGFVRDIESYAERVYQQASHIESSDLKYK